MAASKSNGDQGTLDGNPAFPEAPYVPKRSDFLSRVDREQSGGLDDDPTDSGDPVRNKTPFKNLKG